MITEMVKQAELPTTVEMVDVIEIEEVVKQVILLGFNKICFNYVLGIIDGKHFNICFKICFLDLLRTLEQAQQQQTWPG